MTFLDVPSSSTTKSSFLLTPQNPLNSSRPTYEPPIHMPGSSSSSESAADSRLKTQVITPKPSFVLKSYLATSSSIFLPSLSRSETLPANAKCFINITHHAACPEPPAPTTKQLESGDLGWVPSVVGDAGITVDKVGNPSLVIDIIFSPHVHDKLKQDAQYKLFIIEIALELVEDKLSVELSRNHSLPKTLNSKGPLLPRSVLVPSTPIGTKPLAQSVNGLTLSDSPDTNSKIQMLSSIPHSSSRPNLGDASSSRLELDPTTTTLTLTVPLPSSMPTYSPSRPPPAMRVELVEPQTIVISVDGWDPLEVGVRTIVSGKGVKSVLAGDGLRAEWLVAEKKVVVYARYLA